MPKITKLRKYRISDQSNPYTVEKNESNIHLSTLSNKNGNDKIDNNDIKEAILSRGKKKRQKRKEHVMIKKGYVNICIF
jgi:hypothetical protein